MTIKLLCSFVIVTGFGYFGIILSSELENAIVQIRDFINAFKYLDAEISMNNTVLSEAAESVSKMGEGVVSDIFREMSDEIEKSVGEDVKEVWCRVIDRNEKRLCMGKGAMSVIKDFSAVLGGGTRRNESENIRAVCEKLKIAEEEAMRKKAKNSALYKSMGFVCGILITVLLL